MSKTNYKLTKYACYYSCLSSSSVVVLPPMLFAGFNKMYNVSYTLLGTLVLVNFFTQLLVDLIFTFFSKYFNVKMSIKLMPLLESIGFIIYALVPFLFKGFEYLGLLIGTIVFSAAGGLGEVLLSPTVAAIPSDTPEKDMSTLHSLYGYGVSVVVIISSIFIKLFSVEKWMFLVLLFSILPLFSFLFFCLVPLPNLDLSSQKVQTKHKNKNKILFLCTLCIFLGGAAEVTMTNWISVFAQNALKIPKLIGDTAGFLSFAFLLALSRTFYAKYGKNILNTLNYGMIGAAVCYIIVAISTNSVVSLIFCVMIGISTAMLWPGTLILMEEKLPGVGVAAYALMASGGDLGASVAPQLVGVVVDVVSQNPVIQSPLVDLNMSPEEIGMKAGMLCASVFPILGVIVTFYMKTFFSKNT